MTTMLRSLAPVFLGVSTVAVMVLLSGCGGGNDDPNAGKGTRITDPARVPSATPMQNPTLFKISGSEVRIEGGPSANVSPPAGTATASKTYKVKAGDNCGSIAAANNITLDELLKANRTIDAGCTNLHEGDPLKIPAGATPTAVTGGLTSNPTVRPSGKTYTVKSGDTCSSIAASYGVTVANLIALNNLDSNCSLDVDKVLKIP
jgi:LysM repeat protein